MMAAQSIAIAACNAVASGDDRQIAFVRELRSQLESAQHRIEELESILGLKLTAPPALRIPPYPLKILGLLLSRPRCTYATIETALYGDLSFADWPTYPHKAIKAHVCHLRTLLAYHKVIIGTVFEANGCGSYFMTPDMKAAARKLLGIEEVRP